jgi:hypothetical protein
MLFLNLLPNTIKNVYTFILISKKKKKIHINRINFIKIIFISQDKIFKNVIKN